MTRTNLRPRCTRALRKLASLALISLMMLASPSVRPASPSRKSPEFTIHDPSGKDVLLSSFKGKVVMIEFLFLRSPSCIKLAITMNKLNEQLSKRGFQPVAIAFAGPNSDASSLLVGYTAENLKLTYPMGNTTKEDVDQYLSRGERESLRIPQVIIIDRAGMIRARTGGRDGDLKLEDEAYLHTLLQGLLDEGAPKR